MQILLKLTYERSTAHKTVYQEVEPGGILGTLYLSTLAIKQRNKGRIPKQIEILIDSPDGKNT